MYPAGSTHLDPRTQNIHLDYRKGAYTYKTQEILHPRHMTFHQPPANGHQPPRLPTTGHQRSRCTSLTKIVKTVAYIHVYATRPLSSSSVNT